MPSLRLTFNRGGLTSARPHQAQELPRTLAPNDPAMASPAAADLPNGISTPPTTASGAPNPSPPTASSTQPNTQTQPSQSQLSNGTVAPNSQPKNGEIPLSHPMTSLQDDGNARRPRDARLVHLLLANLGVNAYTERVPLQLMDFAYRYTSSILSDAIAYEPPSTSSHASKKANKNDDDGVSINALRTAVGSRAAHQFSPALPKEFMSEIAAERNRIALPRVEREFGVRLPPERYCFTGVGWGVKESWEDEVDVEGEESMGGGGPVGGVGADVVGMSGLGAVDTVMGGTGEDEEDEDQFEEVMGGDTNMADG